MNRKKFLRLGLFQLTAGGLSVLFLGILNRVMRVELGLDLLTVTILVGGGHYLGALIAIPFGYYSDRHPLAGYRRSAYILLGALITVLVLVSSPGVARWISDSPTLFRIGPGFLFFLMEGISTTIAGTAYLSLITDLTTQEERGKVTSWIWTLLMVGIILTGIFSGFFLEPFEISRVIRLFSAAGGIGLIFTGIALWRQEERAIAAPGKKDLNLELAFKGILKNRSARWFGGFLFLSMFSFFMQDVLLEPFGGEVFLLSAAETTRFNAYLGLGLVAAMLGGGMGLIPAKGKPWTTSLGIYLMIGSFSGLAVSSVLSRAELLPLILLCLGAGSGFFTVGGVSMMMDMTSTASTGLYVGAWTLIQAAAKGPTAIVGGALQTGLVSRGFSAGEAYAVVFFLEALGLLISLAFLRRVAVDDFREKAAAFHQAAAESPQ